MLIIVGYDKSFVRAYKKLNSNLQTEIKIAIESFKNIGNHLALKVHKLTGKLSDLYAFSVNYKIRIVFEYLEEGKEKVSLLRVGNHDIYK